MNKKGFTLVELLAVIAILAVLMVFALPNAVQAIRNSKKNAFLDNVKNIITTAAAEARIDSTGRRKNVYYCRIDGNGCNGYEMLDLSGTKSVDFIVRVNKDYVVSYIVATDGMYQFVFGNEVSDADLIEDPTILTIDDVVDLAESNVDKVDISDIKCSLVSNACES